jgi:serine/threonine protein kinase
MERPLWDRIQEIYYSTLPMPQSERSVFVARACDHDPFLEREVNSLLDADDSSGGFLESPVFELGLKIISSKNPNRSGNADGSSLDNLVGTTIDGRYLVERALGKGGMGKVYFARDITLHNRPVVIKVLLQASLQDEYVVKKFRQEVEALARIDHPGVVGVFGAGELPDGKPFIVMQYVSGVTLRSQIPSEGMNLERAAQILKQIGAALDDVHEKGIFHRDLKPDNIMLQVLKGGADFVKVVDFGIAKVKDSVVAPSTANNIPVGTVLYMSPEQLRGGEKITAASDIYSMGVIAYEMVTGRRPFSPTTAPQLLEMHRAGVRVKPIDLRTNLSTEAQAIILRSLSFERMARYQNAAEFGNSLALALMNEGETAPILIAPPQPTDSDYSDVAAREPVSGSFTRNDKVSGDSSKRLFKLSKPQLAAIGICLVILIAVAVVLLSLDKNRNGDATGGTSIPTRSFTYSLTVQRMRNNKPYQDAFQSTGQDIFESGDKFRLNVSSSDPGYLYVFNEGPPEPQGSSFTIIYPTPATNNGSATLGADQWVRTNWNTFKGQADTENFWIVWSMLPVAQLESAKVEAFKQPNGTLTDRNLDAVKSFLMTKEAESKTRYARDKSSQQTTVRGTSDVLVRLIQFQHR